MPTSTRHQRLAPEMRPNVLTKVSSPPARRRPHESEVGFTNASVRRILFQNDSGKDTEHHEREDHDRGRLQNSAPPLMPDLEDVETQESRQDDSFWLDVSDESEHFDFPSDFQDFPSHFQNEHNKEQRQDDSPDFFEPSQFSPQPNQQPSRTDSSRRVHNLSGQGYYSEDPPAYEPPDLEFSLSDKQRSTFSTVTYDSSWKRGDEDVFFEQRRNEFMPTGPGGDEMSLAISLGSLGVVQLKQGKAAEAQKALLESLALKQKLAPGLMVFDLLNNLGNCANLMGQYAESLDLYQQALEDLQNHDGPIEEIAHSLFNIGRVQVQRQQWEAAVPVLDEAWGLYCAIYGESHCYVAQTLDLLGFVQFSTGDHNAAIVSFQGGLETYRNTQGEESADVANSLCNIGLVREAKGDYERAWNAYATAKTIYERLQIPLEDPGHEGARRCLENLEMLLQARAHP